MNKFLFILLLFTGLSASAQVGIGTITPDPSAQLEVLSSSKGMLVPRLTFAQRNSIASPANSLLVYQTDNTAGFYFYTNGQWLRLLNSNELQAVLAGKENAITAGTTAQYFRGDKTFQTLDKTAVGLNNVDNTSDANKPVSTATQTALTAKENTANKATDLSSADNTKYPTTKAVADALTTAATTNATALAAKENTITAGTTSQYFRGDKTFQTLDKASVGLSNVDNTSDANKPISTATQTALNAKENTANKATDLSNADDTKYPTTKAVATAITASEMANTTALAGKENTITAGTNTQYFRGDKTFQTLDKTAVGLNNVDNTSDANKPVSTATQTALTAKENTANKATDLSSADNTKYPTTKAVADALTTAATTNTTALAGKENAITAGTTAQYFRGDKTFQTLDKTAVGLNNVDNTSDINKPVSTATQTALTAKENTANKATDLSSADNTKYPTTKAVADALTTAATANTTAIAGKENAITAGTTAQYFRGDKTFQTLDKAAVGLNNVDNTSDINKPVSTATQTALTAKENTANKAISLTSPDDTKFPTTKAVADALTTAATANTTALAGKENTITAGTTAQYFRGDKTFQTLDKTAVGLNNVDNTSDANKPVSTATQTALADKENTANKATDLSNADNTKYPTTKAVADALVNVGNGKENAITAGNTSQYFRGDKTFQTLDKTAVGLNNVDNTSDADKPVSTATQTALTAKENTANKATDLNGADNTKYPTTKAVADALTTAATANTTALAGKENTITAGTTAQYFRGDKTFQTLDKTAVGLNNVDNTSDADKPVSTATQTALTAKENTANKATDLSGADNTKYPTTKAVADALATVSGWAKTGNANINANTDFIGTTDYKPFNVRVNNEQSGKIDPSLYNTFWGYRTGQSNTTGSGNTSIGAQALRDNTTGVNNTANGSNALAQNTTGYYNTSTGANSLMSNTTGSSNTATGMNALMQNATGVSNTATGSNTLTQNTTGHFNTATGMNALTYNATGDENSAYGFNALASNTTGKQNVANGSQALMNNTSGEANTANGASTLLFNTTGSYNTTIGIGSLVTNKTGNSNTALGYAADVNADNLTNATAIGNGAIVDASNKVQIGNRNVTSVKLGSIAAVLETSQIKLTGGTPGANKVLTSDADGLATWQTPTGSGWTMGGNANTDETTDFIGTTDGKSLNIRVNNEPSGKIDYNLAANTFWGYQAGTSIITGTQNTAIGKLALQGNSTSHDNTAVGFSALKQSNGEGNTATGKQSLTSNTAGNSNTANGKEALALNTSGSFNTATGVQALASNATGSINTALGAYADVTSGNLTNATAIGYNAKVDADNKVQIGNTSVTAVKLGGTAAVLETSQIKLTGGSPGANKVLTSDANGLATWATPTGSGWAMGGNANISEATDFIGTTDNKSFNVRVNNQPAGRIDANVNSFWGYQAGAYNTTGKGNTANGGYALNSNTTGQYNTANGAVALLYNTTGNSNTANGYYALYSNETGYNNTALGASADVGSSNLNNATAIGYGAIVNASDKVRIGNTSVTVIEGQVPFTNASDRRFKTNIKPMELGLDFITKLKPVSYQMKDGSDKRSNWGFIAQDIESLVGTDNAVLTIGNDKDRSLGLRYTDFISPMVKAVQELNEKVVKESEALKAENIALKKQLETLKQKELAFAQRLDKLEAMLQTNEMAKAESTAQPKTKKTEK